MKRNKKTAISLIVLVITIIILSILATAVIISLSNTNIMGQASDAVNKTEIQQIKEVKTLMLSEGMMGNNPVDQVVGNYTLSWDSENKKVLLKYDSVVIPEDFHYVEGTKNTGVVIEDKDGNQFVWVPVEYTKTGVFDDNGLDEGFTEVFKTGELKVEDEELGIYKMKAPISEDFVEPNDSTEEKEEYYSMMRAVQKYNGFFIARFEAGRVQATNTSIVSKRSADIYNFVSWTWAKNLSKNFAEDYGYTSVVSTLCYGVQWDATLNFISDAEHSINDSKSWGNYHGSPTSGSGLANMNYLTGRSEEWKAKNIYDLAGSVCEWTMEATPSGRVCRGGSIIDGNASERSADGIGISVYWRGFRPTLYIVD